MSSKLTIKANIKCKYKPMKKLKIEAIAKHLLIAGENILEKCLQYLLKLNKHVWSSSCTSSYMPNRKLHKCLLARNALRTFIAVSRQNENNQMSSNTDTVQSLQLRTVGNFLGSTSINCNRSHFISVLDSYLSGNSWINILTLKNMHVFGAEGQAFWWNDKHINRLTEMTTF